MRKMQEQECNDLLIEVSKQVKEFYETPVIFLTRKDYSEIILTTICNIRDALQNNDKDRVLELIIEFHLQWLHAVNDIEGFCKMVQDAFTKDDMCQVISFTIDALNDRIKWFQAYFEKNKNILRTAELESLNADLEIIEEMHTEVTHSLLEKIKLVRQCKTKVEFTTKVTYAIDELFQWIDNINDGLAMKLCKHIHLRNPNLAGDLTKTLQKIFDTFKSKNTEISQKILNELKRKGKDEGSMIRYTTSHMLEIDKVNNKIHILDDRMRRLEAIDKDKPSAALMALQNKKEYLERRLDAIENLRTSLKSLQKITSISFEEKGDEDICSCKDFFQLRIFNHSLPLENREQLVTELCYLWDIAIFGERSNKSMISILSATDMKEEFTDELGTFYTDEHSRKIYKLPDDETLYQPNEHNELVPLSDDADHIYSYDECGRYYIDTLTKQRVYKAHETASEYMMDSFGVLLKMKEEKDGVTYYYDNYGRYYINEEGKHIYRDPDSLSEYENDGLGNLVRIRSHLDVFESCPDDTNVTEDFKYLKNVVGKALRVCVSQVLLHQPQDPIKYLSKCLIKYRENIEIKDRRARAKEELNVEREIIAADEGAAAERAAMEDALLMQGGSETSYDSNFVKYNTNNQHDIASLGGT